MNETTQPVFAPQLYIQSGVTTMDFYIKALGAVELRRFSNDDGSIHVSELSVNGTIFHVHEEKESAGQFSPLRSSGSTVLIGLFVNDVDEYMNRAIAAGATVVTPAQDYDYGYRQGEVKDPFGHIWMFEKKL